MTTTSSIADVTIAEQAATPRFADGFINLQEVLRRLAESVVNEIMSAEVDQLCEATHNSRNGYRERSLFPDDGTGRYQGAAVSETCATGTGTRKVQRVAAAMGMERLSKDQASAMCEHLDSEAEELAARPLGPSRSRRRRSPAGDLRRVLLHLEVDHPVTDI